MLPLKPDGYRRGPLFVGSSRKSCSKGLGGLPEPTRCQTRERRRASGGGGERPTPTVPRLRQRSRKADQRGRRGFGAGLRRATSTHPPPALPAKFSSAASASAARKASSAARGRTCPPSGGLLAVDRRAPCGRSCSRRPSTCAHSARRRRGRWGPTPTYIRAKNANGWKTWEERGSSALARQR